MAKINKRKNVISMLSGFMRDVSTVGRFRPILLSKYSALLL